MKQRKDQNSITLRMDSGEGKIGGKIFLRKLPATILCALGLGWMGSEIFPSTISNGLTAALILFAFALFLRVLMKTKFARWTFLSGMAALGALALIFLSPLRDGFCILGNDILTTLSKNSGHIYLLWGTNEAIHGIAAAMFLGFFIELLIMSGRISTFILMVACALGAVFGVIPGSIGTALFLVGALLILLGGSVGEHTGHTGLILLGGLAAGSLVVLCLGNRMDAVQESLTEKIHEIRYDSSSNSMSEGQLKNLGTWKKNDATALKVTMEEPEKLYLRGMTGEVYTGQAWTSLEGEVKYPWSDTFYYLHKDGYNALNSISNVMALTGENEEKSMGIENVSACREHAYLPYALCSWTGLDDTLIGDDEARGETNESLTYYTGSVPEWYEAQSLLADQQDGESEQAFLQKEEQYRNYVQENYLAIPEDTASAISRSLNVSNTDRTLSEIKDIILETLEKQLTYNEDVVTNNKDTDFLTYVLEGSGSGYSVHYATAATLMLRYFGVPARYVEGYFLSKEDASHYSAGETIELTEENAHAWAEYYLDGIGWIPFETTPGYIDDEEINAGTGDETGAEKHYKRTEPEKTQDETQKEEPEEENTENGGMTQHFAPSLWWILLILLIVLVVIIILLVLRERRKLKRSLNRIRDEENREAIASLYGYAAALLARAKLMPRDIEGAEVAEKLNREALFSEHAMSDEQRSLMEAFVAESLKESRAKWNTAERFFYRWIRPIYL